MIRYGSPESRPQYLPAMRRLRGNCYCSVALGELDWSMAGSPHAPLSVLKCVKMCTFLPQNKMRVKCGPKMRFLIFSWFYPFARA